MSITAETEQKIRAIAQAALQKIGAEGIERKVDTAVKFAKCQLPMQIVLDGKSMEAVVVDIATVFNLESVCFDVVDNDGKIRQAERIEALSLVITDEDVKLCKTTYDVVCGATFEDNEFKNVRYRTTTVDELTEKYVC